MVIMMVSKTIDAGSIPAEPVMLRKRTTDVDSFYIHNSIEGNLTLYDANEKKNARAIIYFFYPFKGKMIRKKEKI